MGCCRPHSLPQERYVGTKRDRIKIYNKKKKNIYPFTVSVITMNSLFSILKVGKQQIQNPIFDTVSM